MKKSALRTIRSRAGGFSLVEIVIAIAIVGVAFIAIIGTLSVGVTNDQASSQQTIATNIAASLMSDLRSSPGNVFNGTTYSPATPTTRFAIPLPLTPTATPLNPLLGLPNSQVAVLYFDNASNFISPVQTASAPVVPANAIYVARVYPVMLNYVGPGAGGGATSQYNYQARINVAWPARAPLAVGNVDVIAQFILH